MAKLYPSCVIIARMSETIFYTRKGDDGSTGLLGEGRLPKHHPRIETVGDLDEANAALGLARAFVQSPEIKAILTNVQKDLYALMAEVAATKENAATFRTIGETHVENLETQIAALSEKVAVPKEFILPGETQGGGALALARTVTRCAERRVAALLDEGELENPFLLAYLNRLSSLCFILELAENQFAGQETQKAKA